MPLPLNKLVLDRYIPTRLIGSGGMADIYEASDRFYHKAVALKTIKASFVDDFEAEERFKNEARYISMFDHRNIVKVFNCGKYNKEWFVAYELMTGKTLKSVIDERKLTEEEFYQS